MSDQPWDQVRAKFLQDLDDTKRRLDALERKLVDLIEQKLKIDGHVVNWGLPADEAADKMAETKARFDAMTFDEIMTYSTTNVDECLDNPSNFMHLFERFSLAMGERVETLTKAKALMIDTITETELCLEEMNEMDKEDAVTLHEAVQNEAARLTQQILKAYTLKTKQNECITKMSHQLERKAALEKRSGKHSGCTCQEQREASPRCNAVGRETDFQVQGGHRCGFIVEQPVTIPRKVHPDGTTCHCWQFM